MFSHRSFRMKTLLLTSFALVPLAPGAITFTLDFVDAAGQAWDAVSEAVVTTAANEWGALFVGDHAITVTVTFANAGTGGYLGQWEGGKSYFVGDNVTPWQNTTHTLRFNADLLNNPGGPDLWFDPTPATADDLVGSYWDALSVARHEFGHLLGFTGRGFYVDNAGTPFEVDHWGDLLTDSPSLTFDAGGLAVPMYSDGHTANSGIAAADLMNPSLLNGVRREISTLDLQMLSLAYGYALIPEPSAGAALVGGFFLFAGIRRRRLIGPDPANLMGSGIKP